MEVLEKGKGIIIPGKCKGGMTFLHFTGTRNEGNPIEIFHIRHIICILAFLSFIC